MAFASHPIPPGSVLIVLSDDDRRWLIYALDVAVDQAALHRGPPLPADQWRELRKALAL